MDGNAHKPTNLSFTLNMVESGELDGYAVGGRCSIYKAGATLLVGDQVYMSAANTANKSATTGTVLGKVLGVVVGGFRTDMRAMTRKLDVGVQAALVNEPVIVLCLGKFWIVSDSAIAAGDPIIPGTVTAGRSKTGTVAADFGRITGNALEAAGGAGVTIMAVFNV